MPCEHPQTHAQNVEHHGTLDIALRCQAAFFCTRRWAHAVQSPTLCAQTRHHCYFVRCMVTMDTHSEHGRMPLTDLAHVNFPHLRLEW